MSGNKNGYKAWQAGYENLEREWDNSSGDWSNARQQDHLENMKFHNERELMGREEARDRWGDYADDGHDERIERLRDRDLQLDHAIAHAEGEHDYQATGRQDMHENVRREVGVENDERWGFTATDERRDHYHGGYDHGKREGEEEYESESESESEYEYEYGIESESEYGYENEYEQDGPNDVDIEWDYDSD